MREPQRWLLPGRRSAETFELKHGGQNTVFAITLGYYKEGQLGEVFINGAKAGSDAEGVTHDGAVLLSLALQHGVSLATIKHALLRNSDGKAATIIGAVVDKITERD